MHSRFSRKKNTSSWIAQATRCCLLTLIGFVALRPTSNALQQESTQSGNPSEATIRTSVREVLVPVVVTDKKGHYVDDLKMSDFSITEDGVTQKIVTFSKAAGREDAASADAMSGQLGAGIGSRPLDSRIRTLPRSYWILFDSLHSSFTNFHRVKDALAKLFQQERNQGSQYSLIAIGRSVNVVQNASTDPSVVLSAIQDKRIEKTIMDSEASNTAQDADRFSEAVRQYCEACPGACSNWPAKGDQVWCSARTSAVQSMLTQLGERALVLDKEFLRLLEGQLQSMARVPSSRVAVFISDGFNRFAGQEFFAILQGFGARDRSFIFNAQDLQPELETVLKEAVASNTRFYTIDSRGVYTLAEIPGSGADASSGGVAPQALQTQAVSVARAKTDALAELAHETGGVFFENSNDLLKGIRRAFADGREYYMLTYVPTNAAEDGKFRKISVEVKQNLYVNAKAGYWAAGN